ncbi:MAG: hypothetical protein JW804_08570 [Sedimentisphaerales bacterium]|nr:hypothetical protein [Sedimentisphaerales bacterium]
MSSGKNKPIFHDGVCNLADLEGRNIELKEETWENHIIKENKREYFRYQFDKIILTLQSPDRIVNDSKEKDVVHYEKHFDDFYILNTVLQQAYVYVIVNWKTLRIRTVYADRKQRTKGKVIWPSKS